MNYIEQINVFWLLDAEHFFNGNETRLYFYLLKLSNSLYWKNPLANADGYTASNVGISINTLKTARNRLQQAGLIRFRSGGSGARDKSVYQLIDAGEVLGKVSNPDTLSAKSLTPNPPPNQRKADDNSKHKRNETSSDADASGDAEKSGSKKNNAKGKKEKPPEPHWQALVKVWYDFNAENFSGFKPSFEGEDPRDLKAIVQNLCRRAEAGGQEWTEDVAVDRLRKYLKYAFDSDDWIRTNFLLSNLKKQLDKFLKNANANTTGTPAGRNAPAAGAAAARGRGATVDELQGLKRGGAADAAQRAELTDAEVIE
jgi:hypothetical protein